MNWKRFFIELGQAVLVGIAAAAVITVVGIAAAWISGDDMISLVRQLLLIGGALVLLGAGVGLMFRRPSSNAKFPEWEKRFTCFSISYFLMPVGFVVILIGCAADYLMRM